MKSCEKHSGNDAKEKDGGGQGFNSPLVPGD